MFTNAHIACSCRWRGHALPLLFFYLFLFVCLYLWYIAVLNRAREWALLQPWQALRYNRPYIFCCACIVLSLSSRSMLAWLTPLQHLEHNCAAK